MWTSASHSKQACTAYRLATADKARGRHACTSLQRVGNVLLPACGYCCCRHMGMACVWQCIAAVTSRSFDPVAGHLDYCRLGYGNMLYPFPVRTRHSSCKSLTQRMRAAAARLWESVCSSEESSASVDQRPARCLGHIHDPQT